MCLSFQQHPQPYSFQPPLYPAMFTTPRLLQQSFTPQPSTTPLKTPSEPQNKSESYLYVAAAYAGPRMAGNSKTLERRDRKLRILVGIVEGSRDGRRLGREHDWQSRQKWWLECRRVEQPRVERAIGTQETAAIGIPGHSLLRQGKGTTEE